MATATYVPAPVDELPAALAAFEEFLQERGRLPDLIQCAMLHAQFESIHPFVGGNGRLGRLLITLFLIERRAPHAAAALSLRVLRGSSRRVLHAAAARAHPRRVGAVAHLLRRGRARDGRARDSPGPRAHPPLRTRPREGQGPRAAPRRRAVPHPGDDGPRGAAHPRGHQPDGAAGRPRARGPGAARGVGREALAARVPRAARPRRRAAPGGGPAQRVGRSRAGRGRQVRGHAGAEAAAPRRPPHGRGHGHHRRGARHGRAAPPHRRARHPPLLHRPRLHGPRVLGHRRGRALRPDEGDPRALRRARLHREPLRHAVDRRGPAAVHQAWRRWRA